MASQVIGDGKVHPDALAQMRERGGRWAAYQNHALDSAGCGSMTFMAFGPGKTVATPPDRHPDTKDRIMWKYVLVGEVDLETGLIKEVSKE